MKERDYLKNKILLAGQIDGQKFKRTFNIVKKIGDGGAMVVAYEAYHSGGGRGVLREFYPKDSIVLTRDSNGQLILSDEFEEAKNRLLSDRERYVSSYQRILDVISGQNAGELTKFLPIFEIYYGCDEDMNEIGTAYIWTPEPKLQTFDKVCEDNHRHPKGSPEYKLISSLKAISTLTEAIMELHMTGFIHRDIKPSNFGFQMFHNKISTENFKIFDIDSIIPVTARRITTSVMSEGFAEPEALTSRPSVKTDIYSIGATLFAAIIVVPETEGDSFRYKDEYYDRIDEMVAQSALISSSEMNSSPRLRHAIAQILKKTLCPRAKRYERCEDLLKDIEDALFYALPGEITCRSKSSEKWVLTSGDVKATLDKASKRNSAGAFINHLYEYPFYRYSKGETIDVLIAGFDGYSQKFADLVLQTGHMSGRKVRLTVLIEDEFERMIYLEERPALGDFYTIDGKCGCGDSYGEICFVKSAAPREFIATSDREFTYILLNPEGDDANYAVAKQAREAVVARGYKATISYMVVGSKYKPNYSKDLYPLCINYKSGTGKYAAEIDRMAFNVHLLWEPNLNVDLKRVRREYMDPYNRFSSLCAVLSLKYKLYSIGFDLDAQTPDTIAAAYSAGEYYNELVYLEHKRWVTEKICTGWTRREVADSRGGATRDRKARNHICVLTSRPDTKLRDEYTSKGLSTWDSMSDEQLADLDELDRMSVELHRLYLAQVEAMINAGQLSITSIQNSPYYKALYHLVDDDKQALLALQEWFALIREIYVDSPDIASRKVKRYASLKEAFVNCCAARFSERVADEIRISVDAFDSFYRPVILSREYRDWKQADANIIEAVPFIITYTTKSTMVIPYELGGSVTDSFNNIAAATVVNPSRIVYLALLKSAKDADDFITSLQGVAAYAAKKNLAPVVDILVLYKHSVGASINHSYEKQILATNMVRSVTRIAYKDMASAANSAKTYLKTRVRSGNVAMMLNDTPLCKALDVPLATFRFDSSEIKFTDVHGCEEYMYITKKPFFTVAEAMAFMSQSYEVNAPEFYGEVDALWDKYHEDSSSWHALANTLKNHALQKDFSMAFEKAAPDYNEAYRFILPYYCSYGLEKLCSSLNAWEVINNVQITGHTSGSIVVSFMSSEEYRDDLSSLFSNSVLLGLEGALVVKGRSIFSNSLSVENVRLSGAADEELLSFFQNIGYINCLRISGGCASFTYATAQVKALLTEAGAMLQIYAYHALKSRGDADDIICNYKPDKDASEYDIVMTRGYKMYYIKCVNGDCPKQDYPAGINSSVLFIGEQGLSEIEL